MSVDIAIDYNSGDLLISPNHDFERRIGADVIAQRIRVRLRIYAGEWSLDPTGHLGSRLHDVLRMPSFRTIPEAKLAIAEALEPMTDIKVVDIDVSLDDKDSRLAHVQILYAIVNGQNTLDQTQTLQLTTTLALGS